MKIDYSVFDKNISSYIPDLHIEQDVSLKNYSSFRIGGIVSRMAFPKNYEQLVLLQHFADESSVQWIILGNGSNILFPDYKLDLLIISTSMLDSITVSENMITAGAGVLLSKLSSVALNHNLAGLEFAHGIPGSLGGAVVMNAGAYGESLSDFISNVKIFSPDEGILEKSCSQMDFAYRHSILSRHKDYIVLEAKLSLHHGIHDDIYAKMKELNKRRKDSQPLEYPSAGSVFKRPEGYFAGKLIQDAGLKGYAIGGAQVSHKHAGFIINTGNATSEDVTNLIQLIQEKVSNMFGVYLETEIIIIH